MYCVSHLNTYYYTDVCKTSYSDTCLNWILNKTESCINQTINKVQMYEISVTLTCIYRTPVYSEHKLKSWCQWGFGLDWCHCITLTSLRQSTTSLFNCHNDSLHFRFHKNYFFTQITDLWWGMPTTMYWTNKHNNLHT